MMKLNFSLLALIGPQVEVLANCKKSDLKQPIHFQHWECDPFTDTEYVLNFCLGIL